MTSFTLEEIRNSAMRLDSRCELGEYVMKGPRENLMEFDTWLAWSSVAARLHHEGYTMVPPKEYAENNGITVEAVMEKIEKEGTLFALVHVTHEETYLLVPMAERADPAFPTE